MRASLLAVLLLFITISPSIRADDGASPAPPVRGASPPVTPLSVEGAAAAVLAAVGAKDDAALKALAANDDPDPWLVADELIHRGEHDVADSFAKAAPRKDVERLPEYVASRRGKTDDASRRARLATVDGALAARKPREALDALGPTESSEPLDVVGVRLAMGRGFALAALVRLEAASAAFGAAGADAERIGWLARAAIAFSRAGSSAYQGSALPAALAAFKRARALCELRGDRAGVAGMLVNVGAAHNALGDPATAIECYERALKEARAVGQRQWEANALGSIGIARWALGDHRSALSAYEQAQALMDALGDREGAAKALSNIGLVHDALGDYAKALSTLERALSAQEALGDKHGAANTLGNLGTVYLQLEDPARALVTFERALAAKEALGDRVGASRTLSNIGNALDALGEHEKALSTHERALAAQETLGDKAAAAKTLGNIGLVHESLGDHASALAAYERARAAMEALGDRAAAARALGNIGTVRLRLGEYALALSAFEGALAAKEALGDKAGVAMTLGDIADARLRLRDWAGTIDAARRGAALLPFFLAGLGDEQGATARQRHATLYTDGALAAAETRDVGTAWGFLECGRAGSLLEALGARASLQSGLVPQGLAEQEASARAKEAQAARALRRALDGSDLEATRARRRELDAAQAAVESAVERIQRDAKDAANVVHFRPDDLDTMRKRLAPEEALVLYGLLDERLVALVVTPSGATITNAAATSEIQAACETLLAAIAERVGSEAANRPAGALRDLVLKPLGLTAETKRLLVSPDGPLSYVPFALLAPELEFVYVPSGTTYGLLLDDGKARGDGVLALGDPAYEANVDARVADLLARGAAGRLTRLPASADEARAVGGTVLLGREATEKGLRGAVASRPRWRSVHFACHGLLNSERPGLSSLALTADGEDDGLLTALEVFGSRIPADLVVLSACETAKGKVVKGEGIMGLTRAFMFAGSPRVICSLWKVDDDATRALMTKFYELWNPKDGKPGLPTAEALRKAQEFVKSHEKWKHPYYWAAWVLWGLPS